MIAKIIVTIFLFILMILCQKWSLDAIHEKDDKLTVLFSIAASLFGMIFGIMLGSLIL